MTAPERGRRPWRTTADTTWRCPAWRRRPASGPAGLGPARGLTRVTITPPIGLPRSSGALPGRFYRRLPTPVLSPAGSTHEIQPGDRASSRDGPLTLLSVRGVMGAPAGDTSLVPLVACPKRLIQDAQDEST